MAAAHPFYNYWVGVGIWAGLLKILFVVLVIALIVMVVRWIFYRGDSTTKTKTTTTETTE